MAVWWHVAVVWGHGDCRALQVEPFAAQSPPLAEPEAGERRQDDQAPVVGCDGIGDGVDGFDGHGRPLRGMVGTGTLDAAGVAGDQAVFNGRVEDRWEKSVRLRCPSVSVRSAGLSPPARTERAEMSAVGVDSNAGLSCRRSRSS